MLNKYLYDISITITGVITFIFILTCFGLTLHIPVNILFTLIPCLAGVFYLKKQSETVLEFNMKLLAIFFILVISFLLSVMIWDISYDGRSYHIATTIMFKNGWLPLYENYKHFAETNNIYPPDALWSACYVHAFELISANIYKLTDLIESAKSINFIMLSCSFMYSLAVLREFKFKIKPAPFIISAFIILNPICLCQCFTNYIDLPLYCIFTVLIFTVIKIENNKHASKTDIFVFICATLMTAMSKYTGLMYAFIVCGVYLIYLLIFKREIKKYIKTLLLIFALIMLTGIHPFYTNYKDFGHVFHPVFGEHKYDYTEGNYPPGFRNKSGIQKFVISTFSEPVNAIEDVKTHNKKINFKIPFSAKMYKKPLNEFDSADMRICGFGYLWSEILLLSLLYLFLIRFETNKEKRIFYLIQSIIIMTTLANPQSWWARYVPQLWLFPITVLLFGSLQNKFANKYFAAVKYFILILISLSATVNSAMIFKSNFKTVMKANIAVQLPYLDIEKNFKKNTEIILMRTPECNDMPIADETIIVHMYEIFGKDKIFFTKYDESKISSKEFKTLQYYYVIQKQCYFYKLTNKSEDK